jgi:hypothetical protein
MIAINTPRTRSPSSSATGSANEQFLGMCLQLRLALALHRIAAAHPIAPAWISGPQTNLAGDAGASIIGAVGRVVKMANTQV